MKTNQILVMGLFMAMLVSAGCQTAPMKARTTIEPMPKVNPLTSIKRTTVVTSTGTNISMVESIESPEQGQLKLKIAELEGRTKIGVARAKSQSSSGGFWATPSPYYYGGGGYYSSGGYYGNGRGYVNRGEAGVNYHYGGGSDRSGGGYVNRGEGGVNYTYGRR